MSFVALHRGASTSLATDELWLQADALSHCARSIELLQRLEQITAGRAAELQRARDAAIAQGLAEGRQQALAQEAPRLWDAWDQAARSAQADAAALREALVQLSLQVVQHIATELAPADVLRALAARAAEALLPDSAAVVRVHPALAAAVRERVAALPGVLEVRGDAALGAHDCVFDTPAGQLLAGLPQQLQRLSAQLEATP